MFDFSKAAVAEHMTTDADVHVVHSLAVGFETLKNFLNSASRVGNKANVRMICWSLLGVRSTKDGSSLIIVRISEVIAWIGLNFVCAVGVGKNAQSVRSNSRVTKFLSLDGGGALVGALWAC